MNNKYYPLPQPNELTTREKEDAMGAYLMMFASLAAGLPLPVLNLVAAIIYYYINRRKSRFVQYHTLHSLLAQIPVSLLNAFAVIWAIRIIFFGFHFTDYFKGYLVMIGIANLIYIIFSIVAAVKARSGQFYYFIFFGRFAYQQVFYISDKYKEQKEPVNLPPKM